MFKYLSKVWYILRGSRKKLPWLLVTFALSSLLEAIGIGFIGAFLNLASSPESIRQIPLLDWFYMQLGLESVSQFISVLGLIIAGIFCIKSLLYFLARSYMIQFSFGQEAKLASRLVRGYLKVPYTFYLRKNTAALIKNISHETMRINHDCLQPILTIIANSIVVCALLFVLAKTDSVLLVMILAIILPIFLIFYQFKHKLKRWGKELSESNQEIIRVVNHSLGSLKETRVIGCEAYFHDQMEHQTQKYSNAGTRSNSSNILPRIIIEASLIVFILLFISISQLLFQQSFQEITSIMAVFSLASIRLIPAVSHTIQGMSKLQNSSYSVNIIYSDLKEIEKEEDLENIVNVRDSKSADYFSIISSHNQQMIFNNQIDIRDILYSYPNSSNPVLNNICLTIKKGESIGLIGKSGAGKTTLVDVILGLLYPEDGEIMVDNVSIYKNIRSWQNLIGYIPQSIFLMDDTIERNIAFGVPDHLINGENLNNAIKSAQLEELIEQLPNGINTSVGERGVRLSGGQRQRIGIARALYHGREILVLDEATSALDTETETLLNEAIKSLAGKKTLIIITHRLSTIEHCDKIYLLEKGRVRKSGNYQEVVTGSLSVEKHNTNG